MNRDSSSAKTVRLRDRLREATAEAILRGAEAAFAAEGAGARMESIAARAGIAVGTLYNHFEDREALWRAVCRASRQALLVRLDAALREAEGEPFPAALGHFVDALLAHWAEHRGFLAVLVQTEPAVARGKAGKDRSTAQEILARAQRLVAAGERAGVLRPDPEGLHAAFLVGMMRQLVLLDFEGAADPASAAALRDRMVSFFLRGAGR
ncbi:MAG TPA: TetR/AcrR family transcriptional regulator [Anaeromyxobacteraceae bacterium]|nr:TetR/AcrR family transcriptional regulator [Anaeromyxobacteraceae bacterium]